MRRENPIHPLRHSEERIVRRENPILSISIVPRFSNSTKSLITDNYIFSI